MQCNPQCPIAQIGICHMSRHIPNFLNVGPLITDRSCGIMVQLIHKTTQIITALFIIWNHIFLLRFQLVSFLINHT